MKSLFLYFFIFYSFLLGEYQKVKVGSIDSHYTISKDKLKDLILEIETELEEQLQMNIFDYGYDGKPIDLVYMGVSKKQKRIEGSIKELQRKLIRIERLQKNLQKKQTTLLKKENTLLKSKKKLDEKINSLNSEIESFNEEIKTTNKNLSAKKERLQEKQRKLQVQTNRWEQTNRNYEVMLNAYNQLVINYRFEVKRYNRLQRKLELLAKNNPTVQGITKGYKKVIYKTFQKNGNFFTNKEEETVMEKIEIYGYESLDQLKAILAHELLHLVGAEHINTKGALMNPLLQKEQIERLRLTEQDIIAVKKAF